MSARVLRDPDTFPASDLALRQRTGLDTRELTARAEAWRPWRSYATFVIWSFDNLPRKDGQQPVPASGASLNRQKQGT